jgi:hypothetical protein
MLQDYHAGGGVELHTDILRGEAAKVIPTDWFYVGTRLCSFRNLRVHLPEPTRSVGHIVAHDQLHHDGYRLRRFELRQLLDLAMIRASQESAIDWAELDNRFSELGHGAILATYLGIAESLLGQQAPRLRCAPRPGAMDDFRVVIQPTAWQRLKRVSSMVITAAARRRREGTILELFDPHKLSDRIRLPLKAYRSRSW